MKPEYPDTKAIVFGIGQERLWIQNSLVDESMTSFIRAMEGCIECPFNKQTTVVDGISWVTCKGQPQGLMEIAGEINDACIGEKIAKRAVCNVNPMEVARRGLEVSVEEKTILPE